IRIGTTPNVTAQRSFGVLIFLQMDQTLAFEKQGLRGARRGNLHLDEKPCGRRIFLRVEVRQGALVVPRGLRGVARWENEKCDEQAASKAAWVGGARVHSLIISD